MCIMLSVSEVCRKETASAIDRWGLQPNVLRSSAKNFHGNIGTSMTCDYRKICRHHLKLQKVYDPLFRERVERIVTGRGKTVPHISEVAQIIGILRKDSIGEGWVSDIQV